MRSQNECGIIGTLISMRRFRNLIRSDPNPENQSANFFLKKIPGKLVIQKIIEDKSTTMTTRRKNVNNLKDRRRLEQVENYKIVRNVRYEM